MIVDPEQQRQAAVSEKIRHVVYNSKKFAIVSCKVYNLDVEVKIQSKTLNSEGREWITSAVSLVHSSYGTSEDWIDHLYAVLEYRFSNNNIIITVTDPDGNGTTTHYTVDRSSQA